MSDVHHLSPAPSTVSEESLSYRLQLMVALAAEPGNHDSLVDQLIAKLDRQSLPYSRHEVRAHLVGALEPTLSTRQTYALACHWHDDTSLLDDDPEVYLRPLMQSEIMLCARVVGVPRFRGAAGPMCLPPSASVDELREQRARLRTSGRIWTVEAYL